MLPAKRSWIPRTLAGVLSAAATLDGCEGDTERSRPAARSAAQRTSTLPPPVAGVTAERAAVDPAIVRADNMFGLNLLQALQKQVPGESSAAGDPSPTNIALSPLSAAMALQVLYNAARGTTQMAMARTLQLGALNAQKVTDGNAALQASLTGVDPKVQLTIANSLWTHLTRRAAQPAWAQPEEQFYGATVGDLAVAPANINAWIASETSGLITNMLPSGDYADVVGVVVNAIYFKGQWARAFDVSKTTAETFSAADGTVVTVQMMHQSGTYDYLQGANFQMIRLPYGQGRMSMLVLLPDRTVSLEAFVAGLSVDDLDAWIAQMHSGSIDVGLPRFTSRFKDTLIPSLQSLGMGIAFSCPGADFSALAAGACISEMQHAAVVEVDETGTVAAAATVIFQDNTGRPSMTMDRPFLYVIRDDDTGDLLFLGTIQNPGA